MDPLRKPAVPRPTPALHTGTRTQRVLVADDEEAVRVVLRRYFLRAGWHIVEVEDGRQAYEWLLHGAQTDFNLIICDLRMPGMSGPELYRWLLDAQPALATRLLFTTGDRHEAQMAEFLTATGCAVLEKPFELATLRALVDAVTARVAAA